MSDIFEGFRKRIYNQLEIRVEKVADQPVVDVYFEPESFTQTLLEGQTSAEQFVDPDD